MSVQDDLRKLTQVRTQAFTRINQLADMARRMIDDKEREAIKAVEAAKTVEEIEQVMRLVAIGDDQSYE